jgi:predicted nucleotidyltransferase
VKFHTDLSANASTQIPSVDELLRRLLQSFPAALAIYLFGSAQDRDTTAVHDLDIAVHLGVAMNAQRRWDVQQALSIEWNIDVDLIDFVTASGTLKQQILQRGKRLYAIDAAWQDAYEAALINEHLDFLDRRRQQDRDIIARGRVYG